MLAGELSGNAGWARGGPNGQITARLTRDGNGCYASGTRSDSTGALFADWGSSLALDDEGREVGFVVRRDRQALQRQDDFDAMGRRLAASGTTVFDPVRVLPHQIRPPLPACYQLPPAAVEAGIARKAFDDAVHFTQRFARPIEHSSAMRSVDDP